MSDSCVDYGARPGKGNNKRKKGVDEYAVEHWEDFLPKSMIMGGNPTRVLFCRFCCFRIAARSDRINEHLASRRHKTLKSDHYRAVQKVGGQVSEEKVDSQVSEEKVGSQVAEEKTVSGVGTSEDDKMTKLSLPTPPQEQPENMPSSSCHLSEKPRRGEAVEDCVEKEGNEFLNTTSSSTESCLSTYSSPPLIPQQLLNLKWINYNSTLINKFSRMRNEEQFVDITLMCEGKAVNCHKLVLAMCSTYFKNFLRAVPNPGVVIITNIRLWELESLVEFMYNGKVYVKKDQLQDLFRAAKIYQICGLQSGSFSQGLLGTTMESGHGQYEGHSSSTCSMTATPKPATANLYNYFRDYNGDERSSSSGTQGLNGNSGHSPSLPLSLSGNRSLDDGRSVFNQASNRIKKTATRRLGNLDTPRAVPPLVPIFEFVPDESSMDTHYRNDVHGSASGTQQRESVWRGEDEDSFGAT